MSGFLNIAPSNSKSLHEPIFKNALKLKRDAITLAQIGSYSTATSLLVLSSEEVIKALLVLLHSEGYHVYRIDGAKKYFTDHKIRHELSKLVESITAILESIRELVTKISEPKFQFKNQFWNELLNVLRVFVSVLKPIAISHERIKEFDKFNEYKNKGFYVDFFDEIIIPENQFNLSSFQKCMEVVNRIFKTYKVLKLIHNPQFVKREGNKEIQDHLRQKINKELKEFSIKEIM